MAGFTLYIQPSQDSVAVGLEQVGVAAIPITLDSTGSIPAATQILFSDELSPQVPFICTVKNTAGGIEWGPETINISGASFDFRTVVPGTVTGIVIGGAVIVTNPNADQVINGAFKLTAATFNYTSALQHNGAALQATDLSNGVTGSGAIVLAVSPILTSAGFSRLII